MPTNLLKKLVEEYYATRPNLAVSNDPLCIFFFACSGSGKSTTRRLLVDNLRATYVCNDEVRELLAKYPEATQEGIELKTIVAETVERIFARSPNKLVIFDNNIIQYYMHDDSYLNVAKAKRRPVFIIGLEAPEEQLAERVRARGINVTQILSELPGQLEAYKKATQDIKPDLSLNPSSDTQALIKLVRKSQIE
ncbi:MAG TPA: AAA family ATPase [Candidatus Saccharimonadales bacterium]|nr:AAA family ATPase [Candidatus Saccharimonadales bacterium]